MSRRRKKLGSDYSMMAWDVPQVIVLRLLKLSRGGAAASRVAKCMVNEKTIAFVRAAAKLASGGSVVKGYRKKVRANRRRLTS